MRSKLPVQVIFREYFEGILAAVFLAIFLRIFVFAILYIPGVNMSPGLLQGDFVFGWKLAYGLPVPLKEGKRLNPKSPRRGDIVSLRFPGDEEQILIRRIVALPGEKIKIEKGRLSVNGAPTEYHDQEDGQREEKWQTTGYPILPDDGNEMAELTVPADSYFVLADNRSQGDDSRSWGVVPLKYIESRIAFIWLSIDSEQGQFRIRWPRIFKKID